MDLQNIIDYVIRTFQYQLNIQNFVLDFVYNPNFEYNVYADIDAMKEVFVNLISNSIKYSFSEKLIKIQLKCEDKIEVKVSDKGIGINEKDIENIFTPFYRSSNKNVSSLGGAGLGLAIVKNILDAHSAEINVESEPGKGTDFIIKFPINYEDKNPDS